MKPKKTKKFIFAAARTHLMMVYAMEHIQVYKA